MKLKIKKGEVEAEIGAEKLIEKGMDQHEKNWKDKFNTKHNAKKEIKELKHKQKLEIEEVKQKKLNWYERRQEEKRKTKELEHKHFMQGISIMIGLMIFFFIIGIIGSILGI